MLAAAHEKGILHRDVKPGKIFLARDGMVKVCALGELHDFKDGVVGTLAFMSPEQARWQPALVDARADVWGLGANDVHGAFGPIGP